MSDVVTPRTTVLGLLSWVIPFVVSFLFVDRAGQFLVPQPLFKSIMVLYLGVVFGGLGTVLLAAAFCRVEPTARSGLALGCYWLAVNLILDLLVLVPLIRMPVVDYLYDIGLRYMLIPIISTAMGVVAARARRTTPPGPS